MQQISNYVDFLIIWDFIDVLNWSKDFFTSSPIKYKQGTNIKVTEEDRTTPNDKEITAGFRKFAWTEGSSIIGIRPTKVVIEVIIIGRKRVTPDSTIHSKICFPLPLSLLMLSTKTRLSLTTTPQAAPIPQYDIMDSPLPNTIWPTTAPQNPNGRADKIKIGKK